MEEKRFLTLFTGEVLSWVILLFGGDYEVLWWLKIDSN